MSQKRKKQIDIQILSPEERYIFAFIGDTKWGILQLRKQLNDEKSYPGSFKTVSQLNDFLTNRPHLFVITDYYVQRYLHYNQDKIEQEQINYNHSGLPDTILPQMDSLENQFPDHISWLCDPKQSLIEDPAKVLGEDLEKQLKFTGPMPSLPVAAKAISDLKSDPTPGLPATIRPQVDSLQNQSTEYISWLIGEFGDPAMVSVEDLEKQLEFTGLMSSLPVAAEVASDLESDPPSGLPATIRPQMDPGAAEAASDLKSEVVGTKVIY